MPLLNATADDRIARTEYEQDARELGFTHESQEDYETFMRERGLDPDVFVNKCSFDMTPPDEEPDLEEDNPLAELFDFVEDLDEEGGDS